MQHKVCHFPFRPAAYITGRRQYRRIGLLRCGGRWADAWFNLGPAGTAGACFILEGPVWGRCAGVAGAWFLLTPNMCGVD